MENNENMNNQEVVNTTSNNQPVKNKNNSALIVIMALIILGLAGYIIYTKVIQKDEPKKDNNTQEKENTNTNENNEQEENNNQSTDVVGTTYKTKDGKKSLKITKKTADGYLAEYNGKKLEIHEFYNSGKYGVFSGDKVGAGSQCGEYYLIVNNQTKELVDMDYDHDYIYEVKKVGSNYYFLKSSCPSATNDATYNEDLKKIANEYLASDNNNFYAVKDGYITKFDSTGKELKHSSIKLGSIDQLDIDDPMIIDNNFYVLVELSSKLYIYDFTRDNKIELNNPYKSYICTDGSCGGGIAEMMAVGKKLLVILHPSIEQERVYQNDVTYLFNTSSNKLDSIGNFLTWETDKDYGEGNFYLYDNTSLYKYDDKGNLVTKTEFDYTIVVDSPASSGFIAYKDNFFVVIKDGEDYYFQDAFNKDKYKIDMVDGYEFYDLYLERKESTNIIKISLSKKDDQNDGGSLVYKFDINNRKIAK